MNDGETGACRDGPGAARESGYATLSEGLRFAFGTLTALRVHVSRWDGPAARSGMLCAPVTGLVIGAATATVCGVFLALGAGTLLTAVTATAIPAVLTRGLHLDGLADTADGLGSGKSAEGALRVMKASDIGPFGVLVLLFTLLTQIASLQRLYADGWRPGMVGVLVAAVTARLALTTSCRTGGVPPARPQGLGHAVAGVVPQRTAALTAAVTLLTLAALAAGLAPPEEGMRFAIVAGLGTAAGLVAAEGLLRHCQKRFGGVTGDVLGAAAETAGTVALLFQALTRSPP